MDKLDVVMGEFGRVIGIDALAFVDDECTLRLDDARIDIIADRKRGVLVLTSPIGGLPDGDRTDVLSRLLAVNCGPTLGAATLAVPNGTDLAVLVEHVQVYRLDGAGLEARIGSFLSAVEDARSLLYKAEAPVEEDVRLNFEETQSMIRV